MPSRSPQSKCLIAVGGPPGRGEAGLVGYPFDAFPVEGIPRTLSLRLPRALLRAALAPLACLRILRRRRPDVVLGGGGYAAGPMVLAAAVLRLPAGPDGAD